MSLFSVYCPIVFFTAKPKKEITKRIVANSLMLDGADWRGPVNMSIKPENIPPIESPIEAVP
tara:strand:+ start:409 stop:594 length:186 start_codon:yes stop_codon:yes gene_type:complete